MKLSLSVRIVESACKTKQNLPLGRLLTIAKETGYSAVCMRASVGGVQSPRDQLNRMSAEVQQAGLEVSMVTADLDVPLNGERGPDSLRDMEPSLDVAEAFGCNLVRVCLKQREDIPSAQDAADRAAQRGIRLAHQCHTSSLFEEVEPMLGVLEEIDRPNFGLIYEPANLMLCGQAYATDTLKKLQPHIMNVYFQNHRLDPDGPESLPTYCRGRIHFHHLDPWEKGGVDFGQMFDGLKAIDYLGFVTVHQAQGIETEAAARAFAAHCAGFVHDQLR